MCRKPYSLLFTLTLLDSSTFDCTRLFYTPHPCCAVLSCPQTFGNIRAPIPRPTTSNVPIPPNSTSSACELKPGIGSSHAIATFL